MKNSMRSRLEQLAHRLIEIDAMLAEPEIASDMDRFRKLSRERSEIEPVVEAFNAYRQAESDIDAAQDMLADPDMREMAEEELESGKERLERLEDRKSTRLNSSHVKISYAVFCLKKKKKEKRDKRLSNKHQNKPSTSSRHNT